MNLCNVSTIKSLFLKHGCNFSKSLGQNFLINLDICHKIVELSKISDKTGVIEIGPGIGALTVEIAKRAKKAVAIEIDSKLIPILNDTLKDYKNVKVIHNDILKVNLSKLVNEEFKNMNVIVCANLPYYITSPIIMSLLESKLNIDSITVMVQKEAAIRMCALPGTRDVGALSLAIRYYSEPEILFYVSRENFIPSPDIDSAVIKLNVRKSCGLNIESEILFFRIIKSAFSQRRKTILNALSNGLSIDKAEIRAILNAIDICENCRAENLSMDDFGKISNEIFWLRRTENDG